MSRDSGRCPRHDHDCARPGAGPASPHYRDAGRARPPGAARRVRPDRAPRPTADGSPPRGWGDTHPATVGVGVAHHPFRPVDEYQPRAPLGPDEPPVTGCGDGNLRDERPEELRIGGQLHQDLSHLVHVGGIAGTQLIQLTREAAERPGQVAGTHLPAPRSLRSAEPTGMSGDSRMADLRRTCAAAARPIRLPGRTLARTAVHPEHLACEASAHHPMRGNASTAPPVAPPEGAAEQDDPAGPMIGFVHVCGADVTEGVSFADPSAPPVPGGRTGSITAAASRAVLAARAPCRRGTPRAVP